MLHHLYGGGKLMRVCVAGANKGLGLVLSRLFAEQGHKVYAGYLKKPSAAVTEAAAKFAGYRPVEMDVTREDVVIDAGSVIRNSGGALDAVVVAAGILPESDRERLVTESDIRDLEDALKVNVTGTALMIKHFAGLVKDGGMFMVITSEAASITNTGAKYPLYSVSKAAQNKLTAVFAKTATNLTVYAVHPGRMNTAMGRGNAQIEPEESAQSIFRIITGEKKIPKENGWFINYLGEPMEI
jgi:NAD(P)-dependent dehydrogenase (short-subunit alcohol dehydrogenase family)